MGTLVPLPNSVLNVARTRDLRLWTLLLATVQVGGRDRIRITVTDILISYLAARRNERLVIALEKKQL